MASIVIVVAALYLARQVLMPLALALLFSFFLAPAVRRLERLRIGRVPAVLIVVVIALSLIGVFAWIVEGRVADMIRQLPEYRLDIRDKLDRLRESGGDVAKIRDEIAQTVGTSATANPPPSAGTPEAPWAVRIYPEPQSALKLAGQYIRTLISPFLTAGLVVVLVIFMLIDREDLHDRLMRLFGRERQQATTEAMGEAAQRVSHFLVMQSGINIGFGVVAALGLWLIHLIVGGRDSLTTVIIAGFLCGMWRFIPYVGVWVGATLPLALAFAIYPQNAVFLAALGMFIAMEAFATQVVEPNLLGKSTGLSPMAVLLAAIFWTWLWGWVGLLLSTPLTVLLVVMGKYVPRMEYLEILLADKRGLEKFHGN
jgi:predicted PurR-regulated permease PerM